MKLCLTCNFQTAADEQELCPRDGSSMVTVGDDPLLGLVVEGRYRIESVIGQGSAGTVYKAVQELISREVAIKVLHDYLVADEEFIKRFTQEAKASSRLTHPNIITIYDFGVIPKGGRPYIAMDLLKGTPLSDLIAERNHLPLDEAMPIFKQVCSALGEAHRQGVVHRDIKPENIVLVERSGQKLFPIVVDFGIARLVQEDSELARITRSGTVCGSPTYMSPEQCTSSKVDHRSDMYSLGIVIYETLTGEVPFLADELVKVMAMHLSDPPRPLNQVRNDLSFPPELEEIVSRALSKNPDDRFQNMDEFAHALDEVGKSSEKALHTITTSSASIRDFAPHTPGPLALSDEIKGVREKPREMVAPLPKPRDLASRALEELSHRSSTAYDRVVPERDPSFDRTPAVKATAFPQLANEKFVRRRVSTVVRLQEMTRKTVPFAFAAALLVGIVVFAANDTVVLKFLSWRNNDQQVDTLIKEGKLEDALPLMQDLKKQGKLNKAQLENMNKICLSLAKQYAREKRYPEAITLLEQIPQKSTQADAAKQLLRKYKQIKPGRARG